MTWRLSPTILTFLLRISLGWLFFYSGSTKVLDAQWTAAAYLEGATTLPGFYAWLASPEILPTVNALNAWGLLLLGAALLLGVGVRLAGVLGAALMVLYYLPILDFPYAGSNSLLIDQHVIYALALLLVAVLRAGTIWGVGAWCVRSSICARHPRLRWWLE